MNKSFNLMSWANRKQEDFINKYGFFYKEAMGYTPQWKRQPYMWWDYEILQSSPPADWNEWVEADRSLRDVLIEARVSRGKSIARIMDVYKISRDEAAKLFKTYVGYHPAYGGYICNVGVYLSEGFWHGEGHVIQEALDKFSFYVLRRRKAGPKDIASSLMKNITSYNSMFNTQFEPSDFKLVVMSPSAEEYVSERGRQPNKVIRETVENLDPASNEAQSFFARAPMAGEGTSIRFNNRGYDKILSAIMGPWYQQTINERAIAQRKSVEQVREDILSDPNLIKDVYSITRSKWEEAKDRGDEMALNMPPPPVFSDPSLRPRSGAQGFTTGKSNKIMTSVLQLRQEILQLLKSGVEDPNVITQRLNENPQRARLNAIRIKRKDEKGEYLQPIIITVDQVQNILNKINELRTPEYEGEDQKSYDQVITETQSLSQEMEGSGGYSDLKSAFDAASIYFSSLPVDPVTEGKLGLSTIVFNPPANFENKTTNDLKQYRERAAALQRGETVTEPEKAKEMEESEERLLGINEPKKEEPKIEPPKSLTPEEEMDRMRELMAGTINNLIKIAKEMDDEGKYDGSEEIHKVIRKYIGDI
jgi:hypothetical protein